MAPTTVVRETFAAASSSKLPYYIAGGLLALWAVAPTMWGISHADFAGSQTRGELLMLTSFVLVVATIAAADAGGALKDEKDRAAVLAGRVTVRIANDSTVEHNVQGTLVVE